ncbi:hypothetical protein [Geomonas propionica]|uniref:Secreted protein n=1 Tax=Geomonas propionica TaxID=2798582 RepID=A0ABS0YX49_9BACT|nr:hypothetical protein [Geomonas propionica]MBJ6802560.1 hypothetical protein [Geomonas propionica]
MPGKPLLIALLTCSLAHPAHALIGVNLCGPGTSPPQGLRCGHEQLLLGYRDAAGACFWVCCPPNSDGETYDCSGDATPSQFKLDLRIVSPRPWRGIFIPGPAFEIPDTAH